LCYAVRIYIAGKGHGTVKAKKKKRMFKGTVSRDSLLHFFSRLNFLPGPDYNIRAGLFKILQKFAKKFVAQGAPPTVSTTPAAKEKNINQNGLKYFVRHFWLVGFLYFYLFALNFECKHP
jgi:hypothetical protein